MPPRSLWELLVNVKVAQQQHAVSMQASSSHLTKTQEKFIQILVEDIMSLIDEDVRPEQLKSK